MNVFPTIYIIEDDSGLRDGLARLLKSANFEVRAFASPQAFLDGIRADDRGCLLLDIQLPGMSGLDLQARLLEFHNPMPVIIMTGHADVASTLRGMKAGAVDFLLKPIDEEALLTAIEVALNREKTAWEAASLAEDANLHLLRLTTRERQVLQLVAKGLMNKQIAGELGISEITVKAHRGTMMRKMNVKTVADLVRVSESLKRSAVERRFSEGNIRPETSRIARAAK